MKLKVFVVDDDRYYARLLSYKLDKQADDVTVFNSGESLLANLDHPPDLILLDIMMPGISGIEVLKRIKAQYPQVAVLVVSAQGVIGTAAEAIKLGAYDYVTKGQDDLLRLEVIVKNIRERRAMERELEVLRREVRRRYALEGIIGEGSAMRAVNALAQRAASGEGPVAIEGEPGTGKEHLARAIHFNSSRRAKPFVVLDGKGISATGQWLTEALGEARDGTLFLREIGALDSDAQALLLATMDEDRLEQPAGASPACQARLIASSEIPFHDLMQEGRLCADLYDRLSQITICIPPLRLRREDILPLAEYLLKEYVNEHAGHEEVYLTEEARRALLQHHWPGNVQELKGTIYAAAQVARGTTIKASDLVLQPS